MSTKPTGKPTILITGAAGLIGTRLARAFAPRFDVVALDVAEPAGEGEIGEKLGWRPKHSLRRTLPEILARLKADPQRWYQENKLPVPADLKQ